MFNVTNVAGGRLDPPFYPTRPSPFIKGRRLPVNNSVVSDVYKLPEDMELLTISVGASKYNDEDHWSLKANDQLIFETIYTKDVPEGFYFMVVKDLPKDALIEFVYTNASGNYKTVWINYQFLKNDGGAS